MFSTSSLFAHLEELEKARDVLHLELAKASLLLTECKRVCEQRGTPCDVTAIPLKPNTLSPLVKIEIQESKENIDLEENECGDVPYRSAPHHPDEKRISNKGKNDASLNASFPSLLLCQQPGYERRKKTQKSVSTIPQNTQPSSSENIISSPRSIPELSSVDKEEEKMKDPILYICHPPSPELIGCREQYRRVLEAIVKAVNLQNRLLFLFDSE